MNALKIKNISKKYGDFFAVKNLSLSIPRGSIYGLLGPNGAGKTTTIRMVMNIIIPDEGEIEVLEKRMDEEMKTRIGYLPEDRGLYPKMKVGEILLFFAELKGIRGSEAKKKINHWLERFDLKDWKFKKVEELSKGMQQKIQFISTVIHQPDLIILDEPFGGLDPVNTKLLKDIMLEFKSQGVTIIFSTHRMEQVEMICDNICLINKAERVLEGNLSWIKKQYGKNTVILDYEGEAGFIRDFPEVDRIDDYGKFMEVKLKEQTDTQELLNKLVGKIRLHKFEVKEPTLNAIFIEKVGEKNAQNSNSH
jgi:ABC-2 type transport system ATP-binding protein